MKQPQDFLVLVVDDELDIQTFLQTVLEDAGFRVVVAGDGKAALEAVRREQPDFISLDLVMPGGSGIAFLHQLRRDKKWRGIPVMVLTGHARDELGKADLKSALDGKLLSGPFAYLEKPITAEKFVGAVCHTLGLAQPEAEQQGTELRREVDERLANASPEQLEKILELLEKSGRRK